MRATAPACCSSWRGRSTSAKTVIRSAHVATHGERAVDVFYLTDLKGAKIEAPARLRAIEAALLKAASARDRAKAAGPPDQRR